VRGVERFLNRLGDSAAVRHCQTMFACPVAHRLHLVATGRRRPNRAQGPPRLLSGNPGAILDEPCQLPPESVGILRAQVDFEVSAVKTEVDRFDIFGRPIKVVDKESPSNCCHAVNIPEWPSATVRLSACSENSSACRRFDPPFTPVNPEIATLSEAMCAPFDQPVPVPRASDPG